MKKKIIFLALIVVMILSFVLTGCSSSKKNKIKVGYWYNNANEKANNQLIIDEFKKLYPEYEIEMVYIPYNSYSEQVLSMAAAGNLPDVLWVKEKYLTIFAEKEIIENLDPYIQADTDFDPERYISNALEYSKIDGKQYALPRDIGVQVMALNLDIFAEYGADLPNADWTWDDMIALGQELTIEEDGKIVQYGLGWLDYESLIYSNGGRLFSDDGRIAYFDEPATMEAIQMYADLINKYHISPTPSESQGMGNVFLGGKAAMALIGPWDFATLNNLGIRFDIVPFPRGPMGTGEMKLSGLPIAMNANSKHKDIAYELIKFLSYSDTAQQMLADYAIAMPVIEDIAKSEEFVKSDRTPDSMDNYFSALENTKILNHFDGEMEALNVFSPYLDEIYLGDKRVEDLAEEMQAAIQETLDEQ